MPLTRTPSLESICSTASARSYTTAMSSVASSPDTEKHKLYYFSDGNLELELFWSFDRRTVYNLHRTVVERLCPALLQDIPFGTSKRSLQCHPSDFDALVSLMYPRAIGDIQVMIPSQWWSIVRLAERFSMGSLLAVAIQRLGAFGSHGYDVLMACHLRDFDKIVSAVLAICKEPKWSGVRDAELLDRYTLLKIFSIREQWRDAQRDAEPFDVARAVVDAGLATPAVSTGGYSDFVPAATSLSKGDPVLPIDSLAANPTELSHQHRSTAGCLPSPVLSGRGNVIDDKDHNALEADTDVSIIVEPEADQSATQDFEKTPAKNIKIGVEDASSSTPFPYIPDEDESDDKVSSESTVDVASQKSRSQTVFESSFMEPHAVAPPRSTSPAAPVASSPTRPSARLPMTSVASSLPISSSVTLPPLNPGRKPIWHIDDTFRFSSTYARLASHYTFVTIGVKGQTIVDSSSSSSTPSDAPAPDLPQQPRTPILRLDSKPRQVMSGASSCTSDAQQETSNVSTFSRKVYRYYAPCCGWKCCMVHRCAGTSANKGKSVLGYDNI
ncbi:hypothetical protein BD626DRAFT_484978 [Schizophyllum amplum]|uniref:BTB domain-containing protein n=1 Tax=Schizophyllum amplum TaxID=97359 RepID=A0A550CQW0_9AGAR|nr:hypothetical protein BD626DRAFT_484978 [Auriculariopsis ampla]